jgi:hypothetical protein
MSSTLVCGCARDVTRRRLPRVSLRHSLDSGSKSDGAPGTESHSPRLRPIPTRTHTRNPGPGRRVEPLSTFSCSRAISRPRAEYRGSRLSYATRSASHPLTTRAHLLFRFAASAYESRSLAIANRWPFEQWGDFLPNETTAVCLLDSPAHHSIVVVTDGSRFASERPVREGVGAGPRALEIPKGWDSYLAKTGPERGH